MANRWIKNGKSDWFISLSSEITTTSDCNHEIKRCLLLGRKAMKNLDSTLKSRDITLLTKVHIVKSMVFPVVMYGCESLTIKKAECQRVDAFKLWCWRRLLRIPWTARRSNQSILKEINPEYSLGGQMLKLKLQSFGYLIQTLDSLEKTLKLGKIEGGRRRGWPRMRWLDGITDSMDMSLSKLQYSGLENSMDCIVHGVAKSWTQLSDFHFHYWQCLYWSYSNSYLSSWWCHPTISSSVIPFSSCLQSFPASESAIRIRWPKYWSFSISPSNEYSGLISFRIDWFALLAVQWTLKSLLQHQSSKASILWHSAFFMV